MVLALSTLSAQSNPSKGAAIDAARAKELLASPELVEAAIRAYIAEPRKNGAPDLTGMKLKIVPMLAGCRFMSQRPPEPGAPREITLH
jgi:hypothetical protein